MSKFKIAMIKQGRIVLEEVDAIAIRLQSLDCFVGKTFDPPLNRQRIPKDNRWTVWELSTGYRISSGPTKKEALLNADKTLTDNAATVKGVISGAVKALNDQKIKTPINGKDRNQRLAPR